LHNARTSQRQGLGTLAAEKTLNITQSHRLGMAIFNRFLLKNLCSSYPVGKVGSQSLLTFELLEFIEPVQRGLSSKYGTVVLRLCKCAITHINRISKISRRHYDTIEFNVDSKAEYTA